MDLLKIIDNFENQFKMKKNIRCLVTGGLGSFGSLLCSALYEEGYQVSILERPELKQITNINQNKYNFYFVDLNDFENVLIACKDIDIVFHCASCFDSNFFEYFNHSYETNVNGTKKLIAACKQTGIKNLIYTSSHNVCFSGESIFMKSESDFDNNPENLKDSYSKSKCIAENYILEQSHNESMKTCAIRAGVIWGQNDKHFRKFMKASLLGFHFSTPKNIQWDWIYIRDLVKSHIKAAHVLLYTMDPSINISKETEESIIKYRDEWNKKKQLVVGNAFFIGTPDEAYSKWNNTL